MTSPDTQSQMDGVSTDTGGGDTLRRRDEVAAVEGGEEADEGGGGCASECGDRLGQLEFLTVDELASLLRLDRKTVYGMIKRRRLPGVRRCGRSIRIHRDTVLQWFSADPRHDRRRKS